ncbi:MAG: hypothetical protein QOD42_2698 [Sphingomonadales bacterium]|nr:hypothetical protein [Sphingomonadales bacterium]
MPAPAFVPPDYRHYAKQAVPCGMAGAAGSALKLYHLEKAGEPVPDAIAASARAFLAREGLAAAGPAGGEASEACGFVILHRCGADFYFLLMTVWRGANEAWEAVWYRDGTMADFARFAPAYPDEAMLRPTFCVWELGVVAHEAAAWSRYLASPRADADLARWRDDLVAGTV